ncbi:Aspartate-semialdehyde dehydrogenase [Buchnera aphidicola (Cinara kochiana kochiana)]|uniref:Aspartate-semialdehyde dehydrogenase n=1 Tax=Buchnera aphidicola (Cinara kochiana kochiana) TaxID=2518976 RepID=A0A451D5R5_9GAMM|nr:aspartate-semialdehyde dehydrogenase [Buchnera aphidicola]VFP81191.1 Aspartate-semialdehyde dehydrogenase [Buchnera aphidicola (Cinara kochiana kochiana)]
MKKLVGFVGWRGMVGSVLLDRLQKNNDFLNFNSVFFTTSQIYGMPPNVLNRVSSRLEDAYNIEYLTTLDIIISCQGEKYTKKIYTKLQDIGWKGYWIDASSYLRMDKKSIIVLDPINFNDIQLGIEKGIKTFVGGNCTVSLMLMALGGLFAQDLIKWISVSTYQSVSGSGSQSMLELLKQIGYVYKDISVYLSSKKSILEIEKIFTSSLNKINYSNTKLKGPLLGNLFPWIDTSMNNGQTREEWKGTVETNKILNSKKNILIDGVCVRVPSLRCHSQSFTIKLRHDISVESIKSLLSSHNSWVQVVDNNFDSTMNELNPLQVTGTLNIPIGRIKKLNIGKKYLSVFSVGDQLLWGAAEPLRRILNILINQ